MKNYLRLIVFLMMIGITDLCYSYDFQAEGIAYQIISSEECKVSVVSRSSGQQYAGDLIIPEKVEYNGINYIVTGIGSQAFYMCRYLKSIDIPNSVETIGTSAFVGCWELTQINIPGNVLSIGEQAFFDCTSLKSVNLSEGTTAIGKAAFGNCRGLGSISIPASVVQIDAEAFGGCKYLRTVTILGNISTIERGTFSGCLSLNSLILPAGVENIESYAFCDCRSLTKLILPASLKNIDSTAFIEADNIYSEMNLYCLALTPPSISGSYSYFNYAPSLYENATLYVPEESYNLYLNNTGWGKFKKLKSITTESANDDISVMLTVANPEHGEIAYQYPYGYDVKFYIIPADGWNIESVRFNGLEIMSDYDGCYSIENLIEDGKLEIIYSQNTSGEKDLINQIENIKIYCCGRDIHIEGLPENEIVTISNAQGYQLYRGYNNIIRVNEAESLIIVKIGNKSFKLIVG